MIKIRNCVHCGKVFETDDIIQMFCSDECEKLETNFLILKKWQVVHAVEHRSKSNMATRYIVVKLAKKSRLQGIKRSERKDLNQKSKLAAL